MSERLAQVIDTFRIDSAGISRVQLHIQRTFEALTYFAIDSFKEKIKRAELEKIYFSLPHSETPLKGRLVFDSKNWRDFNFESEILTTTSEPVRLEFSRLETQKSGRGPQNFKTTDRCYWEKSLALKTAASDDIIGINELGQITETSRFSLFLKKENTFFTPPLSSGCLDGVFRKSLLESSAISVLEKDFVVADLFNYEIYVGNSLRGLLKARLQN